MLTFFRRIRKGSLGNGHISKPASPAGRYLLYAIGEIALVVIGILIALQINNWNEWKKDRNKEKILLAQLHDEFLDNKRQLQKVVDRNRERLTYVRELINQFPIDPETVERENLGRYLGRNGLKDSLRFIGTATFNPSNAIINTIANTSSIELISNDTLKRKILGWNSVVEDYLEDELTTKRVAVEDLEPYLIKQGIYAKDGLLDKRVDISVLASPEFEGMIYNREWRLRFIYDPPDDPNFNELEVLQRTIDEIIALTAPYKK